MATDITASKAPARGFAIKKASALTRLVQAAVLAVVLVPLGSVALEAAVISYSTCTFYNFESGEDSCGGSGSSDTRTFFFDFGTLTLTLLGMTSGSTDITITEATLTQSEFDAANGIADAYCIPIAGVEGCRMLEITASDPSAFTGWSQLTFWNFDTNATYPNGVDPEGTEPGLVRVYRSEGYLDSTGQLVGSFTEDMCLAAIDNESFTPCEYFPEPFIGDPGIRSGNTDFSVITFVQVPEPSSMLLLGTGLVGLVFRRRKRATV